MFEQEIQLFGMVDPYCKAGEWVFTIHEPVKAPEHDWEQEYDTYDTFGGYYDKPLSSFAHYTGYAVCRVCGIKAKMPKTIHVNTLTEEEWD